MSERAAVERVVVGILSARAPAGVVVQGSTELFESGLLDSVVLTEIAAAVEKALAAEVDFLEVDPDALDTVDGLTTQLLEALIPGA